MTIDGPAGAGKSTVARRLAERLGFLYLDTGAMYRALAYKALEHAVDPQGETGVLSLLMESLIELVPDGVVLDGALLGARIRSPEVDRAVSRVAQLPRVRLELVARQRAISEARDVVMDGRDAGTFVLPAADVKFFLTASLAERVARRGAEMRGRGFAVDERALEAEMLERDRLDQERTVGPLAVAPDAMVVDTTGLDIADVVQRLYGATRRRLASIRS